jgi:cell wall-associated NlpC family hydrolase
VGGDPVSLKAKGALALAALVVYGTVTSGKPVPGAAATAAHISAPSHASSAAISFAEAQLGKPYLWGGTGPGAYDCSGLVQAAWAAAGVSIERTSAEQWATLPHVSAAQVRPGDLVFFPGSDGTFASPGHVAIVISATRMIQAYATGTPIEISPLNGNRAGGIVGFARPGGS